MEDRELKPCKCGGGAVFTLYTHEADAPAGQDYWFVRCLECGESTPEYKTRSEASGNWNTRIPSPSSEEEYKRTKPEMTFQTLTEEYFRQRDKITTLHKELEEARQTLLARGKLIEKISNDRATLRKENKERLKAHNRCADKLAFKVRESCDLQAKLAEAENQAQQDCVTIHKLMDERDEARKQLKAVTTQRDICRETIEAIDKLEAGQ